MSANPNFDCRHTGRRPSAEILLLALAACAPLQQAPLVYSSAELIGVRIGINPTQADTAEVTFGYRKIDAAYAPVAVARPEFKEFLATKSETESQAKYSAYTKYMAFTEAKKQEQTRHKA